MAILEEKVSKIQFIHSFRVKRQSELDSRNLFGETAAHFLSCLPSHHMQFKFIVLNEAKT